MTTKKASSTKEIALPDEITGPALAELLGCSDRQVRQWAAEGVIEKTGRGRYRLHASVQSVCRKALEVANSGLNDARASYLGARQAEIEMRIAEKRGELIHKDEVDFTLSTVIGGMKSDLMSLPARVSRDMPVRKALDIEIARILNSAAARMRSRGAEIAAVIDAATDE